MREGVWWPAGLCQLDCLSSSSLLCCGKFERLQNLVSGHLLLSCDMIWTILDHCVKLIPKDPDCLRKVPEIPNMTWGVEKLKKETFTIIVLLTACVRANKALRNVFICWVSLIVCLFKALALTYCLFVRGSPNVQVSCPSSLLQHLIAKLGNKCLNTHLSKCLVLCCFCSTRSPNWQKISLS